MIKGLLERGGDPTCRNSVEICSGCALIRDRARSAGRAVRKVRTDVPTMRMKIESPAPLTLPIELTTQGDHLIDLSLGQRLLNDNNVVLPKSVIGKNRAKEEKTNLFFEWIT